MDDNAPQPGPRQITTRVLNTQLATVEQADGPVYVITSNWVRDLAQASIGQILSASIVAGVGLSGGAVSMAIAMRLVTEAFRMIAP